MTPAMATNAQLLGVATEAARAAGIKAREMFGGPRDVSNKGPRDLVTDADLAAQQIIVDTIRSAFPDHGFLAEEEDDSLPAEGPVLWIIDPIDGTVNYSRGVPIFCVSVAAVRNEQPLSVKRALAGAVYDPMLDELFTATAAGPALLEDAALHGRPLQTSTVKKLSQAMIGIDWPLKDGVRQRGLDYVKRLAPQIDVFRTLGSATLAMAWVAAGRLDAYVNFELQPWDVAAAALIVKQAGGAVSNLHGQTLEFVPQGLSCLMSNAYLAQELALNKH